MTARLLELVGPPGSDLLGHAPRGAWVFLLPERPHGDVPWVGPVSDGTARRLALDHATPVPIERAVPAGTVVAQLATEATTADARSVRSALRPDGHAWVEVPGGGSTTKTTLEDAGLCIVSQWWLAMDGDDIRCAAPVDRADLIERLRADGWHRPTRQEHRREDDAIATRTGYVCVREGRPASSVPAWMERSAGEAGYDLHGWGAVLWDRGDYATQKVVFRVVPGPDADRHRVDGGPHPQPDEQVVRLARSADTSARVLNDAWASAETGERFAGEHRAPIVTWTGWHDGLAVVATRAVDGVPFEAESDGSTRCALALDALTWLRELGARTVRPVEPSVAIEPLHDMAQVVADHHDLGRHRAAIRDAIDALNARPEIATVLQHGDATPWNVVATAPGHSLFLDWELADDTALPLWDSVLFLVHYAPLGHARRRALRHLRRRPSGHLLRAPHRDLARRTIEQARTATGVDRDLVRPILTLLWVRQAFKDLPHDDGGGGDSQMIRMLRRSADDQDGWGDLLRDY